MSQFKYLILMLILLITTSPTTFAANSETDESKIISETIEAIEMCYHWAGEVGEGNEERQKQIAQGFERDCPIATEKAGNAYQKYPKNAELIYYIFELMDIGYFDVSNKTREEMCDSAISYYKDSFARSKYEDDIYKEQCPTQAKVIYGK